eukprot:3194680-Amphidinium_carterae.2
MSCSHTHHPPQNKCWKCWPKKLEAALEAARAKKNSGTIAKATQIAYLKQLEEEARQSESKDSFKESINELIDAAQKAEKKKRKKRRRQQKSRKYRRQPKGRKKKKTSKRNRTRNSSKKKSNKRMREMVHPAQQSPAL